MNQYNPEKNLIQQMHSSRPNTIQKLKKEKLIDTFSKYNWNLDDPNRP